MLANLWRYMTAPVFNVETDIGGTSDTVIAGQTTKVCTIFISLHSDGKLGNRQEEIDFPRPIIRDVPGVEVSFSEERRPCREILELDVSVRVIVVGKYTVTPVFPISSYYFNSMKNNPVVIRVGPSEVTSLKASSIEPIQGHGTADSIYRGGKARMSVIAKDEFGNHVESGLDFHITADSAMVNLLSSTFDSEKGSHVITLRCDKAGKITFDLASSQTQVVKGISVNIIPPPVSASNSYIIQSDIDTIQNRTHKAGKVIKFKFKLIDIFGNPLTVEESDSFLDNVQLVGLHDSPSWSCEVNSSEENDNMEKEESSLKVYPSDEDPTACDLEFKPPIAGKRQLSLKIAGKEIHKSKMNIAILPGDANKAEVINKEKPRVCQTSLYVHSVPYRRSNYLELYEGDQKIICMGVARRYLIGPDQANIKNLNRVLEKEFENCEVFNDLISRKYGNLVVFDLGDFPNAAALQVFEVLSLLVRSEHHRIQANMLGNEREEWNKQEEVDNNYLGKERCRRLKQDCGRLMNENNEQASDAIFEFYNYGRPQSEIDLHGQRVANSENLNALRRQLLGENKSPEQVNVIIDKQRLKRDEAIRKLDERLRIFDHKEAKQNGEDWLEIIDGAGHHSATRGQQKIRPKVQAYLKERGIRYMEANEGALLITFSEYTGQQPCVGNFYCKICNKTWTSICTWKGFFQRCYKCDYRGIVSNCYPFKLRSVLPQKRRQGHDFTREDHRRLCQKCMQLGKDCRQQR